MSIIRAQRPESRFTIVDNNVIRDERLSWLARGILIGILSRPDNWRTSAVQIAKESPKERRDAALSALRELKTVGYMIQHKMQDDRGRWKTVTYVFDTPQDVSAGQTECGSTGSGPAESGLPGPIRSTDTENHEEVGSSDHGLAATLARTPKRKPPKPRDLRKITPDDKADFAQLQALCLNLGEDDPISVWWTLRLTHKAIHPYAFMSKLVDSGQWEGFVGSNGIDEYANDGSAA